MPTDANLVPTSSGLTDPEPRGSSSGAPTVVVGHDGHPASQVALRCAIDFAEQLGAHLHVLHSVTLEDYGIDPDIEAFEQDCERNLAAERQAIATALDGSTVRWTYHEDRGDPALRLAHLAATVNASMIVVGATESGIIRHLIGKGDSVPKRLLHVQARPVLVVPAAAASG
jgi:nucleotide-binding universal stress UspA family protein